MDFQDYLSSAIERVLASDLPDEAYGDAIAHEAQLMAGARPDVGGVSWDD